MKPVIVSGLKPSGELHIGNYLGMLKQAAELQNSNKYRCFYFIADYHALTQKYNPKEKAEEIYKMAVDALAMGLDPKKSVIFVQSHVPEHANLTWIFNTITPVGKLQGMIEYKEKLNEGQSPNTGLLDYPVLMAADILLYKAEFVPVGQDQRQHIELAREIVRTFNDRFGQTFKEPKAVLTKATRIMSLDNPEKKMSKSIPAGCLYLSDSPSVIREKIKRAVTDSSSSIDYDPEKRPAVSNLVLIYSEFSGLTTTDVVNKFKGFGYGKFKEELAEVVIKKLKPFQEKRGKLIKNRKLVMKTLEGGARKARLIAKKTMAEVNKKAGLI
ncbi:MAG: tryptophan--tRNA ligase [Candidatus Colwellbacteria bacterium RIFCSPHIGHO2_12_FULL_43_12]|uniref:Tryptophan--tRNA ligase n=2 Tax=Candidatus Colwelliibacteriota TaxID=1817904 RepID=A0A1G1Z0P8_9BACT|nr:MAG: tryptophan--tRNA ligase [Candidatus Colwellbacteria bacterium RIFCSPHIGHO2_12_FULL_43_12]